VSYNEKHNEANGEENHDGDRHNRSWNLGAEGPTDGQGINATRARQQRNMIATLLLSQGVPMLLGGDELGRSQGGNNNAYCQDNEISWFDWDAADQPLIEFTRQVIAFRHQHPVFRRRRWFRGSPTPRTGLADIAWFKPDGQEMSDQDWAEWFAKSFMVFLNGDALRQRDAKGQAVSDDSFCLVFNAHVDAVTFTPPGSPYGERWVPVIDTAADTACESLQPIEAGAALERCGLSLLVLRRG
jgi:glycogen operon protein